MKSQTNEQNVCGNRTRSRDRISRPPSLPTTLNAAAAPSASGACVCDGLMDLAVLSFYGLLGA